MTKRLLAVPLAALMILGAACSSKPAQPPQKRSVTDHAGDTVELPDQINRVVILSVFPLPAFMSFYLGSSDKIVGIHPVSMSAAKSGILGKVFPGILNASTGFIQGSNLNVEALMALQPDLVFYNTANAAEKEALKEAGVPAVGIAASKWGYDPIVTLENWASLLDQVFPGQQASRVAGKGREVLAQIQAKVAGLGDEDKPRVMFLYQYDESVMITSGKNFFGQYWITSAGGVNVAGDMQEAGTNAIISMEQVYEWDPEVIIITNFTPAAPKDLYGSTIGQDDWSKVDAVKNRRVYKMPLGAYRTFTPGIDTPLTLLWMAATLHPELFADIDMNSQVKDYYREFFGVTLTDDDVRLMFNPPGAAALQ